MKGNRYPTKDGDGEYARSAPFGDRILGYLGFERTREGAFGVERMRSCVQASRKHQPTFVCADENATVERIACVSLCSQHDGGAESEGIEGVVELCSIE